MPQRSAFRYRSMEISPSHPQCAESRRLCSMHWVSIPHTRRLCRQDDGNLDVSDWLIDRKGFLPIPIVITEPAVGYGGGLALMFVRNSMRESAEKSRTTDTRRRLTSSCWEPRRPRMGPGSPSAAAWLRLPAVGLEATRKALLTRWTAGSRASKCCAACAPSKT